MLDYLPEIRSDFSVFHGDRRPFDRRPSRFFEDAALLGAYGGAVSSALLRDQPGEDDDDVEHVESAQSSQRTYATGQPLPDIADIASMTANRQGFPSIAYTSGA